MYFGFYSATQCKAVRGKLDADGAPHLAEFRYRTPSGEIAWVTEVARTREAAEAAAARWPDASPVSLVSELVESVP